MSELLEVAPHRTVGLRDIPLVLLAPRRVFARVEDVSAWSWPLVILLTIVTLIGYATVQTGLIDREIDTEVSAQIAQIDRQQRDVVERSALRDLYDKQYKAGEFTKLLTRIKVIIMEPVQALAAALLVATFFYGATAITGRKPEWHTLLTVCVFAGFIDALRLLVTLGLMLHYRTLTVDTSLALVTRLLSPGQVGGPTALAALTGLLTAADPFRIWYWLVAGVGLSATAQLPGWRAWLACGLCWLGATATQCALALAPVLSAPPASSGT